ncbi:MAG: hypothetical protein HFH24_01755 [Ruminococcus sp.]|nr:hypothetical protein [Ruminococcus sp.]
MKNEKTGGQDFLPSCFMFRYTKKLSVDIRIGRILRYRAAQCLVRCEQ